MKSKINQKSAGSMPPQPDGVPDRDPSASLSELAMSLEPRFMFDAAGLSTGVEVGADAVAEAQAAAAIEAAESGQQTETGGASASDELLTALIETPPSTAVNEIVFVDTSVENYETLLLGIDPNAEVVLLDSSGDGLAQIADTLDGRTGISAIHIISHGDAGQLQLGEAVVSQSSMQAEFAGELATIGASLADSADILIYGCNFAEGEEGREAADMLGRLTGADVAASTDISGHVSLGGDWDLEHQTGAIESDSVVSAFAQSMWHGVLPDTDGDTLDDSVDVDDDNDGILDTDEGFQTLVTFRTDPIDLEDGPDDTGVVTISLVDTGLEIGQTVTVSNVLANGDLDSGTEVFTIEFNPGVGATQLFTGLQTDLQFTGSFPLVVPIENAGTVTVEVISVNGGEPGITIQATSPGAVDDFLGYGYGIRFTVDISYTVNVDTDDDGIANYLDIDSDNDGITDNVEAQTTEGIILPSGIAAGISDDNGDGLDDNFDAGEIANGDGFESGVGLTPLDSDGDGTPDYLDADADDDGVDDIAERGDGQPTTLSSLTDSDGDGLLDIFEGGTTSDADVNDDNLIFGTIFNLADSDNDLAPDGSDAVSFLRNLDYRENNLLDVDEDGVANADDIDSDNDGILNVDEGAPAPTFNLITTPTLELPEGTTTVNLEVDLSGIGLSIGDTVTVFNVMANGDLNQSGEHFSLIFNNGEIESGELRTGQEFDGITALLNPISLEMTVVDIGSGVPGLLIEGSTPARVDELGNGYGVQFFFDVLATTQLTRDSDGDGIADHLDIDSDNDGITDTVEAQGTANYILPSGVGLTIEDDNGDGLDDAFDAGQIASGDGNESGVGLTPIDTDGDSIPDVLDIDSDADGVGDIAERRDGAVTTITSLDDTDSDGLLDIFEGASNDDRDVNDENITDTTTFNLGDSDDDLVGDLSNAVPPSTDLDFREGDTDNDGILNADDVDADNDGVLNVNEGAIRILGDVLPSINLGSGPDTEEVNFDLSATGLVVGDIVTVSNIRADGDLDNNQAGEFFDLSFNSGQQDFADLSTGQPAFTGLADVGVADFDLTVIDIGGGVPGINVVASAQNGVDQFPGEAFGAQIEISIDYDGTRDSDGDGIANHLDIDSDNDGITDNVEAQSTADYILPSGVGAAIEDDNGDGLDDVYDAGQIALGDGNESGVGLTPVNSDFAVTADSIDDLLDDDSDEDGVPDIEERGDNQPVSITDTTDSDADGLLDIFEGGTPVDADVNDANVSDLKIFNLADSDDDTPADGMGAVPLSQDLDFRDDLGDIDGDSLSNITDPDADGDGILNTAEGDATNRDTDADGIPDWLDIDSDNDGITDNVEAQTTAAYQPPTGLDGNNDGIDNQYGTGITLGMLANSDGDATPDVYDNDSDDDGVDDIAERGDGQPRSLLSTLDADSDGLLDIFEGASITDIDPNDENYGPGFNLADTNGINDLDFREAADTDGDGVANISDQDDDNDGILDVVEGLSTDTDGDGVFDYLDLDSDNDGLSDLFESGVSAATIAFDGDLDGSISLSESAVAGSGVMTIFGSGTSPVNSDGDGIPDYLDLDSDNDGIADTIEYRETTGYTSNDGDVRDDDVDGDGVIDQFDTGPAAGIFGGSFSNVANDSDSDGVPDYLDDNSDDDLAEGDDSAESGFTFSGVDADSDGIDDDASIGVSYADPDGTIGNPSTDFPNQLGDTSEVAYRERAFFASDDTDLDAVNESTGMNLVADLIANDTFDNANVGQTATVYSVNGDTGTTLVAGSGSTVFTTDQGGEVTIQADGTFSYDPNGQAVFTSLNFGDAPVVDSFRYTLSFDGGTTTSEAAVNISVGPNNEFALSSLAGSNGSLFTGASADDQAGFKVEDLGDINGDGYDDFAITAHFASPNGNVSSGETYVLFGKPGSFSQNFDLGDLAGGDGTDGFVLEGVAAGDLSGRFLAGGDVNGDGLADLIISASRADNGGNASGEVYVVFGRTDFSTLLGGGGVFELQNLTPGGADGFVLRGIDADDNAGRSVAYAGDVNGDGIGDLLISGHFANPNSLAYSGETYLVFGRSTFVLDSVENVFLLSSLAAGDGTDGTVFNGVAAGDQSGQFVAGAGDFNGDGLQDIVIGAPYANTDAGAAHVIYGQQDGFGVGEFDLSSIGISDGFTLTGAAGEYAGLAVGLAGDINGDGFDDVVVSAPGASPHAPTFTYSGITYIVFGQSGTLASQTLASAATAGGVTINGAQFSSLASGFSLDSAGDVNGDGYDDLLIGRGPYGVDPGAVYVVFGSSTITGTLELSSLVPANLSGGSAGVTTGDGFVLSGSAGLTSYTGQAVSTAGDVNGDGFDDLLIGAYYASTTNGNYSGEAYLVFGADFRDQDAPILGTTGNDFLIGGTADEVLSGSDGNDILEGAGGNDVLLGGAGDDSLIFDVVDVRRVDGGGGRDTLDFTDNSGVTLDLTSIDNYLYRDIEVIDITGAGNNTLRLSALDLMALSGSTNVLTVNGNAGDTVELIGTWMPETPIPGYSVYSNGEAIIEIQTGITITDASSEAVELPVSEDELQMLAGAGQSMPGDIAGDGIQPFTQQLDAASESFDGHARKLLNALGCV